MSRGFALLLVLVFLTASSIIVAMPVSGTVQENSWAEKAPVPVAGVYVAAVVNGKIYVMGGSSNYVYDPTTDTWVARTPMPTQGSWFAIAACQNKIYAIGGTNSNQSSNTVNEMYDPSTDTWATKASMPTSRSEMEAVTVNGKIYVMGGRTAGVYSTVNITEIYNPDTDSWSTGAPMLYPVVSYASAVVDNKIYVIGGQDEFNYPNAISIAVNQIYNPENDSWSLGAPIPVATLQARAGATTGVSAPKRIYVVGGSAGFAMGSNQNYAYDPKADAWINATSMPTACYQPALGVVNDLIYVMGGGQTLSALATNQQYTPLGYGTIPIALPFPTATVATVSGVGAVVVVAGLLVYFKKRKR